MKSEMRLTLGRDDDERVNRITGEIVDAAMTIHKKLGPGLLESVYGVVLAHELRKRGLRVDREVVVPVIYDGVTIEAGFRADLIIEDLVIVELKAVEEIAPVHKKQLLTYLRLMDKPAGLLINFGSELLKDGIERIANTKVLPHDSRRVRA